MSWLWFSVLFTAFVFAVSSVTVVLLISRAPKMEDDDSRQVWKQRARPAKLGRRSKDASAHWRDKVRTQKGVRVRGIAKVPLPARSSTDLPQTVEDAARRLVERLNETERALLRDPADPSLYVRISREIHDSWSLHLPHSEIRFDAEENYEAYDPDAISGAIIEAAQGLLSVGSNSDLLL